MSLRLSIHFSQFNTKPVIITIINFSASYLLDIHLYAGLPQKIHTLLLFIMSDFIIIAAVCITKDLQCPYSVGVVFSILKL